MEDKFIIEQVLSGNTNAFRFLVLRYQKPLFRYIHSFGFNSAMTEEIAQDTFVKVFKKLSSYDENQSKFSTWFFTIAKNSALNELSRLSYSSEIASEDLPEVENTDTPLSSLEIKEVKSHINELIQHLPIPFRNTITLFHLNEISLEEIAIIENCSLGTVKSRIYRAKELLKNQIKQKYRIEGL